MRFPAVQLALVFLVSIAAFAEEDLVMNDEPLFVYVGTYTGGASEGIYLFQMDRETGKLTEQGLAAEVENPSFVALHPNREWLYSVGQMTDPEGNTVGAVNAFSVDSVSGKLTLLNQRSSAGAGPCHVSVDPEGKVVLVANYGGGSVAVFPLQADGSLGERSAFQQHSGSGPNQTRQKGPHAHSINVDPSGRFALAADLGIDQVRIYRLTENGELEENEPLAASLSGGAGPRHLAFHPRGNFAYVINELDSTVTAFSFDAEKGELRPTQTISTVPEGFVGTNWPAEILVHPSGRFLYGSNRGHDSIVVCGIEADGELKVLGHEPTRGSTPRNFGIDPTGRFLFVAHQESHDIVAFAIDSETGQLVATGDTYRVDSPVCVRFR